ncbi:histidinol-phosphate transaminase [Sphingobacterium thalpophilum]|uniref:Aminotransferase n=1 Tax=Sphingobacterium thalpophilum TaxID=259 RepID=A0A4U9VZ72_9SPHI|nr:histidinol-phosphate transaminase [Sphingobacterium thalpophilum]VTR49214.1 Threonine-phosphate decarboxylase [Sphingobacterium thalpophilum]
MKSRTAELLSKYKSLKRNNGNHSPSINEIQRIVGVEKKIIDACYLCNPYAFELSYKFLSSIDFRKAIKYYPPQNSVVASNIAEYRNLPLQNVLVGNGAIEIIEYFLNSFENKNILLPMPVFSTYYDLTCGHNNLIYHILDKNADFCLDIDDFIYKIKKNHIDIICIVNPNNPTGSSISLDNLVKIHQSMTDTQLLIIDESFVEFSKKTESIESYSLNFSNIIVIRSLSKEFGIAGIRLGYAVLPENIKIKALKKGFLWNSNGLAVEFSKLLTDKSFVDEYKRSFQTYLNARDEFSTQLSSFSSFKVYPSESSFFLIEFSEGSEELFSHLLWDHNIYVRLMENRMGLDGEFLRIASLTREENSKIFNALNEIITSKYITNGEYLKLA